MPTKRPHPETHHPRPFHPEAQHVKAEGLMMATFVIGFIGFLFVFTGVGTLVGVPFIALAVFMAALAGVRRH